MVVNGGDGSAYPFFFDSKELAELEEKYEDELWAESSIGWIDIEHEGEIKVSDVNTIKSTKEELEKYERYNQEIPKYEELLSLEKREQEIEELCS